MRGQPERNCFTAKPQRMGPGCGSSQVDGVIAGSGRKSCANRLCTYLFEPARCSTFLRQVPRAQGRRTGRSPRWPSAASPPNPEIRHGPAGNPDPGADVMAS